MADSMTCEGEFLDPGSGYTFIFDDDGRVVYGYLLNAEKEIVSDVWLYNNCLTPESPEWKSRKEMPMANSIEYSKDHLKLKKVRSLSDIRVEWHFQDHITVDVYLFGKICARLKDGVKPGWSRMARKDGPLARVLI